MAGLRLFVISLIVLGIECAIGCNDTIYDRCKLIKDLNDVGVVGIKNYTVADYLCVIHHASGYDTSLHSSESEYGIFQIASLYWCDDGKTVGRMNLCGVKCSELLDKDISKDLKCFARIVRDPKGLEAWNAWAEFCQGKDLSQYITGC
ncbi:hypothetical protein GDO81_013265 [Engystomops pustulosus]|uniref:Glycosyl hydrolases family 22 (GH22) domain-containing protein n=1 Tax=Engystomops pustulosus TaxID=76066 RepID=A0AAV7B3Y7_ENGPU|nr:hypothetical protein GDO81_013265 [Engystomops pustulosus]